jgi:hypothetical protein
MNTNFGLTVSGRQQQWFLDAVAHSTFPWDKFEATINVSIVAEPSCAGHQDEMCTHGTAPTWDIEIRERADDADVWFNNNVKDVVQKFYMELVIHELGHAVSFTTMDDDAKKTAVAGLFVFQGPTGEGFRGGTLADWNPLGVAWEDRIQEAVAECFKDAFLPWQYRVYDNRTNWFLPKENWDAFMDYFKIKIADEVLPTPPVLGETVNLIAEGVDGSTTTETTTITLHDAFDPHHTQDYESHGVTTTFESLAEAAARLGLDPGWELQLARLEGHVGWSDITRGGEFAFTTPMTSAQALAFVTDEDSLVIDGIPEIGHLVLDGHFMDDPDTYPNNWYAHADIQSNDLAGEGTYDFPTEVDPGVDRVTVSFWTLLQRGPVEGNGINIAENGGWTVTITWRVKYPDIPGTEGSPEQFFAPDAPWPYDGGFGIGEGDHRTLRFRKPR